MRLIAVLLFAIAALSACSGDWPKRAYIAPAATDETLERHLPIYYDCGEDKPCDLKAFMERLDVCALVVISDSQPVLHQVRPATASNRCAGRVERERYGVASIAKSVTSVLFGRVMTDPAYGPPVNVHMPAAAVLAESGLSYGDEDVTVQDLLLMSSGMIWSDQSETEKYITVHRWPDGTLASDFETLRAGVEKRLKKARFRSSDGEGRPFNYSGFDTQLLGMMIEHRLKSVPELERPTLDQALKHFIWDDPEVGMRKLAEWKADSGRHPPAYCCLYMAAGDLARFGDWVLQQYLDDSKAMNDWLEASVYPHRGTPSKCEFEDFAEERHYGYQWWVLSDKKNGFTGVGKGGQYLHIFPKQNVVVVQLSDMRPVTDRKFCEAMWVHRLIADEVTR